MKLILSLIALIAITSTVQAQIELNITIKNTKGQPLANTDVTGQNGDEVLTQKTNASGKASFTLEVAGTWTFSYLDQKDVATYDVREGFKGTANRTVTYDPKGVFKTSPKLSREGITFTTHRARHLQGQPKVSKLIVEARDGRHPMPGLSIQVVDVANKTKYTGVTSASGNATFYLTVNKEYEVDVEGIEAVENVKMPNFAGGEMRSMVNYRKTIMREVSRGDTIKQSAISQTTGTTRHMLFELNLKDYDKNPSVGEPVYAVAVDGSVVYEQVTSGTGYAKFMLKKGTDYVINLKYEEGIYLANASITRGFGQAMVSRRYRGSRAIEIMQEERLAQAKANAKGFVTKFDETPITEATKPAGYLKKTEDGFDIDFASSGPIGTPTVVDGKMFTQEGFYSPNFYALNAVDGDYLWGVELGESGCSPAVYHDGVLLINTYSCTLYAIDAENGDLLWSKWLAGTIYSTPSADEKSVYAVYNNGGANPENLEESFVLASFDLRTGALNWMNWVDKEAIACPIVAGDEVHIASQSGNYYVYDKATGETKITSKEVHALSSPTVTETQIFITTGKDGKENLVVLDRATLKKKKTYKKELNPALIADASGSYNQMNFNGAHPIVYKNEVVVILDKGKIMAFDAKSESVLWEKTVETNPNQIPVLANGEIIIGTTDGKLMSYNLLTGTPKVLDENEDKIDGQPISHKGLLYVASAGVLSVIKSITNFDWGQWNKDSTHNVYWR